MALSDTEVKTIVFKDKLVSRPEYETAQATARHLGCPVIDVLIGRNMVREDTFARSAAKFYRVKYADITKTKIPYSTLTLLPEAFAQSMRAVVFHKDDSVLSVAMENPRDLEVVNSIRKTVGMQYRIIPFVTTPRMMKEAIRLYKGSQKTEKQTHAETQEPTGAVRVIDKLLEDAVRDEASDVHIEPSENEVLLRFRIDGVLHDNASFPKSLHAPLLARLKVLANLKLDETRLPQDGQFAFSPPVGRSVSLRLSTVPTVYGEKAVLRVLHDALSTFQLEDLGLTADDMTIIEKVLRRTHGMILMTGPTGSGKTTTLYTMLGLLNKPGVNIITIEDPVENRIRRVNQIQVNPAINLTFASGLRSVLRQDPDIIMVGEIRDQETSIIAVNAAMTGHLVFSSVHANTAASAIPRLIDLGVEPFLVASTLHLVVAQRLVRLLCDRCREPIPLSPLAKELLRDAGPLLSDTIRKKITANYQSRGCSLCRRTGYRGRIGIFEILDITDALRELIIDKSPTEAIWKEARKNGSKTMLEDGLLKVINKQTTIEEVFRVVSQ